MWNGEENPKMSISYINPDSYEASIHSHPWFVAGNSYSYADKPGPEDENVFNDFDCNIIVGAINLKQMEGEKLSDFKNRLNTREHGMAFYGRGATRNTSPKLWLSINAARKIISK